MQLIKCVAIILAFATMATARRLQDKVFEGTAKSAMTGDYMPNSCAYDGFSAQFVSVAESRFAYVTTHWNTSDVCGRCAQVSLGPSQGGFTTPNSTVTVMLVSQFDGECGGSENCPYDIKLSSQAYREMLNGGSGSRFHVRWNIVDCPEDFVRKGIEFAFDDATTPMIISVQPRNYNGRISKMVARFDDNVEYEFGPVGVNAAGSYRSAIIEDGSHSFKNPFTIVVTQEETGDTIEFLISTLPAPNTVVVTDKNF